MDISFVRNSVFALISLLATATIAHAGMKNDIVPCPSIESVQQASSKIDATELLDDIFLAYTSSPAFNESNLPWYVGVLTEVSSPDQALTKGKEMVQNINLKEFENAIEVGQMQYACSYQPGSVIAIGGIIDPSISFRFKRH